MLQFYQIPLNSNNLSLYHSNRYSILENKSVLHIRSKRAKYFDAFQQYQNKIMKSTQLLTIASKHLNQRPVIQRPKHKGYRELLCLDQPKQEMPVESEDGNDNFLEKLLRKQKNIKRKLHSGKKQKKLDSEEILQQSPQSKHNNQNEANNLQQFVHEDSPSFQRQQPQQMKKSKRHNGQEQQKQSQQHTNPEEIPQNQVKQSLKLTLPSPQLAKTATKISTIYNKDKPKRPTSKATEINQKIYKAQQKIYKTMYPSFKCRHNLPFGRVNYQRTAKSKQPIKPGYSRNIQNGSVVHFLQNKNSPKLDIIRNCQYQKAFYKVVNYQKSMKPTKENLFKSNSEEQAFLRSLSSFHSLRSLGRV